MSKYKQKAEEYIEKELEDDKYKGMISSSIKLYSLWLDEQEGEGNYMEGCKGCENTPKPELPEEIKLFPVLSTSDDVAKTINAIIKYLMELRTS